MHITILHNSPAFNELILYGLGLKEIFFIKCFISKLIKNNTVALFPTAQLPEVTVSTEMCTPEVNLEKRRGLHIHKHPVGASFCVFDE